MTRVGQVLRKSIANRIKDHVNENGNVFVVAYSALSGFQMNDFRKSLKKAGADVYVAKNSIAKIALKELNQEALAERVEGQMAFVWSQADSVEVSKVLVKFAKDIESLNLKGGLLEGRLLEKTDVAKLADLPSREVLLALVIGTIQAPLTRLAGALNAKTRDLLSILKQLSEKKGGN